MALTRVAAAGINTGGTFVLENVNTSGIVTAGTVQVGSATTIHSAGIDLGSGNITSHNINSTGIITATGGFVGAVTGNVTGNLTGNVTGNVTSSGANTLGSLAVTNDATVGGALTITGDLTVNGTTTTIDTAVTAVDSLAIDGNAIIDGSVGIGTDDTPKSKLDVFETVSGNQTAIRIGNTNTPTSANDKRLEFVDGTGTTEGTNKFTYGYIQGYREGGSNAGALIFGTKPDNPGSPAEKFRITSSGKVGIGTNNPNHVFELRKDSALTGAGQYPAIQISNANASGYSQITFTSGQGTSETAGIVAYNGDNSLRFRTNGGTERLRITSAGDVGIGTDTPTSFGPTLQVAGTDPALLLQDTATAVDYFGINITSGITQLWYDDAAALTINTASGISGSGLVERLRITSGGNLGINNASPGTKLAIGDGTIDSSNVITFGKRVAGTNSNLPVIGHHSDGSGSGIAICATSSGGKIHFFTGNGSSGFGAESNAERMRIDHNGNVGIGTDGPGEKLHLTTTSGNCKLRIDAASAASVDFYNSGTRFADMFTDASTSNFIITNRQNAEILFRTNGTNDRLRITGNGQIRTGQININAFSNLDNAIGGYTQIACDNHANTFFGQNLKLGASSGSGNYTLEVINQHASIGGAGMYIGGNGNSSRVNAVTFYAVAANQSAGTNVTNQDRLRITADNTYFWTQPTNYYNSAQTYTRTFGFTFNMADGEEEVMFYNPDSYRRIYYQIYIQSGHGSNGYGYILCNTSRYGTDFHIVDWHVSHTTYGHASSVGGNVNHNGVKLIRTGTYGTITYYVIVKAFSPAGGNPFSISGLTDASYRYYSQGF